LSPTIEAEVTLENNIKNLIKILEDSKVDELEISTFWGKQKIKIMSDIDIKKLKKIYPKK
jgi:hypothetical protein